MLFRNVFGLNKQSITNMTYPLVNYLKIELAKVISPSTLCCIMSQLSSDFICIRIKLRWRSIQLFGQILASWSKQCGKRKRKKTLKKGKI